VASPPQNSSGTGPAAELAPATGGAFPQHGQRTTGTLLPVALCAVLLWQLGIAALVLGGTLFGSAGGRGKK
jgi:hypothetical protein